MLRESKSKPAKKAYKANGISFATDVERQVHPHQIGLHDSILVSDRFCQRVASCFTVVQASHVANSLH